MSGGMMTKEQAAAIRVMLADLALSERRSRLIFVSDGIDPDGDLSSRTISREQAERLIGSLKEVYWERQGKRITREQTKKIHALVNALAFPDEAYRKGLKDLFSVDTSKALTERQAAYLINVLEMDGVMNGVWERRGYGDKYNELGMRPNMATPAQLRKIEATWNGLYPEKDESLRQKNLRAFLFRSFRVSDVRFLDKETANKVLFALGNMTRRREETTARIAPQTHFGGKAG